MPTLRRPSSATLLLILALTAPVAAREPPSFAQRIARLRAKVAAAREARRRPPPPREDRLALLDRVIRRAQDPDGLLDVRDLLPRLEAAFGRARIPGTQRWTNSSFWGVDKDQRRALKDASVDGHLPSAVLLAHVYARRHVYEVDPDTVLDELHDAIPARVLAKKAQDYTRRARRLAEKMARDG